VLSVALIASPSLVSAQNSTDSANSLLRYVTPLTLVGGITSDRLRLDQLRGQAGLDGYMIRSASSMNPRPKSLRGWGVAASVIAPEYFAVNNDAIPFSINDGPVWAGVGTSSRLLIGAQIAAGPFRLILAPEIVRAANDYFLLRDTLRFYAPPVPKERAGKGFVFPWYALGPYSIDMPTRFGDEPISRLDAGQSTALVQYRGVETGISNENQWWGPGIRNALILSNNAPGFPHAFVRTANPWKTPIGSVEARLIIGGLTESRWFDTTSNNNVRSLSAFAFSVRPKFDKDLVIGAARSVYATTTGWGRVPRNFLDAFSNVGRPNNRALGDSTVKPGGRDQIFSIFGRWIFPKDGFETYFEWARLEFPYSLRDALTAPNHSQGYTLGLQYARPAFTAGGQVRFQGELTSVEQSATWRDRPQGSFYTSRKVIQGYTQMGQPLGAAIGPGASSQFVALDFIDPSWSFGIFAGRIRWNEDIHSTYGFPLYQGYCIHDVSVYPGARGSVSNRWGYISADISFADRFNPWFQEQSGCPISTGNSTLDIRNRTISVTIGTFTPGRRAP
jgi:hypothetical protein